jgi:membrane protein DedA with SNARE-associated domain
MFQEWGFWIIMAKGLTPIPFKLVTIASGVCELNLGWFLLACTITRTARFYLLATLLWYLGDWAKPFIEKYLGWILLLFFALIVVGVCIIKFIA